LVRANLTTVGGRFTNAWSIAIAIELTLCYGRDERHTLEPMILAGSIVQIDTRKRTICSRKDWKNEFERPIYFFATPDGYVCGWCELDRNAERLTLIPHPMSPVSSQRWQYQTEIDILGRMVAVAMPLLPDYES